MVRGENLLSTLRLLTHRRNAAKLLLFYEYFHNKYSDELQSLVTTSPDLKTYDTPYCCHDSNSLRSPPYCKCKGKCPLGIDTLMDDFLNTIIFTFSIRASIVIYSYLHNIPFLPSTLSFIH